MKKGLLLAIIGFSIVACSKSDNFTVTGTVSGLKKGTLYLQQIQDTTLINVDSLEVNGNPDFEFSFNLKEPQVFYLYLDKKDASGYDDRIPFFAEEGEMNITTTLKNFEGYAAVTGSENQSKLHEYNEMSRKFNDKNLDLLKGSFEARRDGDQLLIKAYDDSIQNLFKRKYLYTGNFAGINSELEVAPYLVITQIPDASISYLKEVYKTFPKKIKGSKYGRELDKLIKMREEQESL